MKKVNIIAIAIILGLFSCTQTNKKNNTEQKVTDEHSSEMALDWNGTYQGMLPCASCPGIMSTVTLNEDKTFQLTDLYFSSSEGLFSDNGTFEFTEDGNKVVLISETDTIMYAVGENKLILLDKDGNKSESEFADMYEMAKLSDEEIKFTNEPVKGYLTLGHEVSSFSPCGSSKAYWINDATEKLSKLYKEQVGEGAVPYIPVMAEIVVEDLGKATEGFPEQYESVLKVVEVKSVEMVNTDNYCGN